MTGLEDDLLYLLALDIQGDPGPFTSDARMMRRLAAGTALKALEDWYAQSEPPEMSVAQRKSLAAMLDMNLADIRLSEAAQANWRQSIRDLPTLGGGGTE